MGVKAGALVFTDISVEDGDVGIFVRGTCTTKEFLST